MTGVRKNPAPQAPKKAPEAPSAQEVGAFLSANPDFIAENPGILDSIVPERRALGNGVVDMQSVLIERLRRENGDLRASHDSLLASGRAIRTGQDRVHGAVLGLLEARSFRELMEIATTDLAVKLGADVVVLGVENENGIAERSVSGVRLLAPGSADRLLGPGRDVVLNSGGPPDKALYGAGAGLVASEALLRLHASPESPTGILALGARDPARFEPGQGTELLGFLARVLELCIRTWLGLPRS